MTKGLRQGKGAGAWWLPVAVLLGFAPLSSRGAADTGSGGNIPAVHGTSLTGAPVELPGVLAGKVGVLVVGFSKDSRDPVAAWGRRLAGAYKGSPVVLYYEMPMLAEVPRLLRGVVVRSMKKEVPERAQPRFVPITEDEARWKSLAGYEKGDEAYVLVVDGGGVVRWRGHGAADDVAFAEVLKQVQTAGRM